jgi:hypothetical protein
LPSNNGRSIPEYQRIFDIGDITKFNPSFELPPSVTATPAVLLERFLHDDLLDEWVKCTNEYAASKLVPTRRKTITRADILRFLATLSYTGHGAISMTV